MPHLVFRRGAWQTRRVLLGLFSELDTPGGVQRAGRHVAAVMSEFAAGHGMECRVLSLNDSPELHRMTVGAREFVFTGSARGTPACKINSCGASFSWAGRARGEAFRAASEIHCLDARAGSVGAAFDFAAARAAQGRSDYCADQGHSKSSGGPAGRSARAHSRAAMGAGPAVRNAAH